MRSIKIAFLLTQSMESPGGLGRFGPIARGLARRGHQVEIFALHPDFGSLAERRLITGQVNLQYVAPMHVIKKGDTKTYYSPARLLSVALKATWRLTTAALSSQAEILHICKPHPMNGLAGLIGKLTGGKLIVVDCDDYEAGLGNFTSGFQKTTVAAFEKTIPRFAKSVTTNTLFTQQNLIKWGVSPEKITYIPNGYEPDRFQQPPANQVQALRSQLEIEGKKVISYIGTVGYASHPVYLLLEAFSKVKAHEDSSKLLIVGGGEDLNRFRTQVETLGLSNSTIITGPVAPDQVALYYAVSDVTVDPVKDDDVARGRSPLKLFEAWACGVPFVTSAVGDRSYLIGNPPAGMLSTAGDSASLADRLLEIIQNPGLAAQLSQRGLEKAQLYSWDRLVVDVEAAYLHVLEHQS